MQHAADQVLVDVLVDRIKDEIERAVKQLVVRRVASDSSDVMQMVLNVLGNFRVQGELIQYAVDDPEFVRIPPFYEVEGLPLETKPGDPYTLFHNDREEYRGVVLAADGKGGGTVLHGASEGLLKTVTVRCRVQPHIAAGSTEITFRFTL